MRLEPAAGGALHITMPRPDANPRRSARKPLPFRCMLARCATRAERGDATRHMACRIRGPNPTANVPSHVSNRLVASSDEAALISRSQKKSTSAVMDGVGPFSFAFIAKPSAAMNSAWIKKLPFAIRR